MSDAPKTPVPARPASTVVILRDGAGGIEVFMVVRHHQIDFASGALVFPGGKVDAEDSDAAWGDLAPQRAERAGPLVLRRRRPRDLRGSRAHAGAPARHAARSSTPTRAHRLVETYRAALLKGETTFVDIVRKENLALAADLMVPFAHWITPEVVPKRFDTHFFLIAAPVVQLGAHDGGESVEGLWITPQQALSEAKAGTRTLVFATRMNLGEACTLPHGGRGGGDHALTPGRDGHAEGNENAGRPQAANPCRSGLWRNRSVRRGRLRRFGTAAHNGLRRSHRRRLDVDELDLGVAVGHP